MSYGVDYPNISGSSLYTSIDTYVATGSQTNQTQWPNGALNPPGSVYAGLPVQLFNQYAGFSSYYSPITTVLGTTATATTVTSVNNTGQLAVGQAVSGSGVAAGTTISAITSTTAITLSAATTSSVTLDQLTISEGTKIFNGFPPVVKYVRYLSQNNPAVLAYPSVVYYTDSTGTTVTGYAGEAFGNTTNQGAVNVNACAGVLLYNTTVSGLSGSASATALNGNWCWMVVAGLVPGVKCVASCIIGDTVLASSSATAAFTVTRQQQGTNAYPYFLGTCMSNLSTNTTCDLLVNPLLANL